MSTRLSDELLPTINHYKETMEEMVVVEEEEEEKEEEEVVFGRKLP